MELALGLALGLVKVMVRVLVRLHLQVHLLAVAPLALALVLRRPPALAVSRTRPLLTAHPVGLYTSVICFNLLFSYNVCWNA
jgi:hypothetical protein